MKGEVLEDDLPGIGRRYMVQGNDGALLTIVLHNSGRRDLYLFPSEGADPVTVSMDDRRARLAAAVLSGDYSPPETLQQIDEVLGDLAIEWYEVGPGSPGAGQSIGSLQIRSATGINVMAILREHNVIHGPRDSEVLSPGDRLIVAGRRSSMPAFRRLVVES
ncbi:MAG TPA: TrkA C-terminal domain-containing protein [Actinomycetota bacterium]|nr:TrkA C-terminal domain-containing protein [Actinomycetota bacterium]